MRCPRLGGRCLPSLRDLREDPALPRGERSLICRPRRRRASRVRSEPPKAHRRSATGVGPAPPDRGGRSAVFPRPARCLANPRHGAGFLHVRHVPSLFTLAPRSAEVPRSPSRNTRNRPLTRCTPSVRSWWWRGIGTLMAARLSVAWQSMRQHSWSEGMGYPGAFG